MGDLTVFEGKWNVSPPLDEETQKFIEKLRDDPENLGPIPADKVSTNWHFGWEYFPDEQAIGWDSGEKFYDYSNWIQCLLKYVLAPRGYILLNGVVTYSNNGGFSDYEYESMEDEDVRFYYCRDIYFISFLFLFLGKR